MLEKPHDPDFHKRLWLTDRAIKESLCLLNDGYKNIILTAPWGIGKSITAYMIGINYTPPYDEKKFSIPDHKHGYDHGNLAFITPYTNLQDQYLRDFDQPDLKRVMMDIRGRNRYHCNLKDCTKRELRPISGNPERWKDVMANDAPCTYDKRYQGIIKIEDIVDTPHGPEVVVVAQKYRCEARELGLCEYYNAKEFAINSKVLVSNPDYILRADQGQFNRDLVVWDEAHQLVDKFVDLDSFELTEVLWEKFGMRKKDWPQIPQPKINCRYCHGKGKILNNDKKCKCLSKDDALDFSWWIKDGGLIDKLLIRLDQSIQELIIEMELMRNKESEEYSKLVKQLDNLEKAYEDYKFIKNTDPGKRVSCRESYHHYKKEKMKYNFKPIDISENAKARLKLISHRSIFMTATLFRPDIWLKDLGLDISETAVVSITESPFPIDNRLINILTKFGRQTFKKRKVNEPLMLNGLVRILKLRLFEEKKRGAILYNSHRLGLEILKKWKLKTGEDCSIYHKNNHLIYDPDYNEAIHNFKLLYKQKPNFPCAVMSTVGTGIDFPGDEATWLCIPKLPFPSIGDPWVKARLNQKDGREWFAAKTSEMFFQMTGRANRSPTDFVKISILDAQAKIFIKQNWSIIPHWLKQSLMINGKKILNIGTSKSFTTNFLLNWS